MIWVGAGDSYLVAGTDGVGTKLKLAFETGIHHTIGIDLVTQSRTCLVCVCVTFCWRHTHCFCSFVCRLL